MLAAALAYMNAQPSDSACFQVEILVIITITFIFTIMFPGVQEVHRGRGCRSEHRRGHQGVQEHFRQADLQPHQPGQWLVHLTDVVEYS